MMLHAAARETRFQREVADRFGVLPNFFKSAKSAVGLIEELWGFAEFAYLDNPLPPLLKERLFVHLSRFCEVRYGIVPHVGFLMGEGRPAGYPAATPLTLEETLRLLRRPVPDAAALDRAMTNPEARVEPCPLPLPETDDEARLLDALTAMFLVPSRSARARKAVRTLVGDTHFELLAAFLAFVRTAHFWTEMHPELEYEPDMAALMDRHPDLKLLLLDKREALDASPAEQLRKSIDDLDHTRVALTEAEERHAAPRPMSMWGYFSASVVQPINDLSRYPSCKH